MGNADYLMQYATACRALAIDYIVRSTRFNDDGVRIRDSRPRIHPFSVTIRHQLEVAAETVDYHGRHQAGAGDLVATGWDGYESLVAAQLQAELSRAETLDELVALTRQQAYAAIREKTLLRTHPARSFLTYDCNACHGAGKFSCNTCAGTGVEDCRSCRASGRTSCPSCGGRGSSTRRVMVRDANGYHHEQIQMVHCSCAGGTVSCARCGGRGRHTCSPCDGNGYLVCNNCSGHGCLTRVTSTHCYTQPHFSRQLPDGTPDHVDGTLDKIGLANVARHGTVTLRDVATGQAPPTAALHYDCTMPFCELTVELKDQPSNWVLFGQRPEIFDADGALEALLREDATQLRTLALDKRRKGPDFHRSALDAVTPFMASEVNQDIVKASAEGLAPHLIHDRINRAVSESYIHNTLRNLGQALETTARWSRLKSIAACAVLSIPFALCVEAYLRRSDWVIATAGAQRMFLTSPGSSGIAWDMAKLTIPFALAGWLLARWTGARWIRQAGGKPLVTWARRQGLLLGKWTALGMIAATIGTTGVFYNQFPIWVDAHGKAYGLFGLFNPLVGTGSGVTKSSARKN